MALQLGNRLGSPVFLHTGLGHDLPSILPVGSPQRDFRSLTTGNWSPSFVSFAWLTLKGCAGKTKLITISFLRPWAEEGTQVSNDLEGGLCKESSRRGGEWGKSCWMGKIQAAQLERGLGSFPQDDGQSGLLLGPERNKDLFSCSTQGCGRTERWQPGTWVQSQLRHPHTSLSRTGR